MRVNANKVIDALELLNNVVANTPYCPALFKVRGLLIEALKPAPKTDANIDDELAEGFGRIIEKPTNRQISE